jgi:hypothetical protein
MLLFLSWIIPPIRLFGWLELNEKRRRSPGIIVGFRGPPAFQTSVTETMGRPEVSIFIDGKQAIKSADTSGRPRWCAVSPGVHAVEVVPAPFADGQSVSCTVEVGSGPAGVAVWPEIQRFSKLRPGPCRGSILMRIMRRHRG